jgi:hypothetical protein
MRLEPQARCTLKHKQLNQLAANPGAVAGKRKLCLPCLISSFVNELAAAATRLFLHFASENSEARNVPDFPIASGDMQKKT